MCAGSSLAEGPLPTTQRTGAYTCHSAGLRSPEGRGMRALPCLGPIGWAVPGHAGVWVLASVNISQLYSMGAGSACRCSWESVQLTADAADAAGLGCKLA